MLSCTLLFVFGCTQNSTADPPGTKSDQRNSEGNEVEPIEQKPNKDVEYSMIDFFLPDGSSAHYEGDGNEFAELSIEVTHVDENHVIVDEDNGGVVIRKIYRIDDEKIQILSQNPIDNEESKPSLEEIHSMDPQDVYLQRPIEVGATFSHWTITETDAIIETAYQQFEQVIIIEMKDNDFTNRMYFAENYVEIKRESVMETEDDNDFVVTSTLETVKK